MKHATILPLIAFLLGASAQSAPGRMPTITRQDNHGLNGCANVNDFRVTFPDTETMHVEYYDFYANAAGKSSDRAMCIPYLTLGRLERGWRVAIGDATWKGYAKFSGGNKLGLWNTAVSWQFSYMYNWNVDAPRKYYRNSNDPVDYTPDFLPGEKGDYDGDFSTTVKATKVEWSPCFQGAAPDAEEQQLMFYTGAYIEGYEIQPSGDAIFGYPLSSGKPMVQEFKLRWEQCAPDSMWSWGKKPMEKPADAAPDSAWG